MTEGDAVNVMETVELPVTVPDCESVPVSEVVTVRLIVRLAVTDADIEADALELSLWVTEVDDESVAVADGEIVIDSETLLVKDTDTDGLAVLLIDIDALTDKVVEAELLVDLESLAVTDKVCVNVAVVVTEGVCVSVAP